MSAYKSDYERLLETVLREYKREITQTVGRKLAHIFEAILAGEGVEIPVIGGELPPEEYRTPEYYDELQATVVRALCARKWHEYEAAVWAQPLPLTEDECLARYNTPGKPYSERDY